MTAFLLEEDEALKTRMTVPPMTVSDSRQANRVVQVWFGQPDLELSQRTYPYVSIELIDINEAQERVMAGIPTIDYVPSGWAEPTADQALVARNFPTPYDLDYQVTTWARHPRHDRQLVADILSGRLPMRFGRLPLATTNRMARLDMLGGPRVADTTDEDGKRLFRKVFTVRVSTELFTDGALELATRVSTVHVSPMTVPPVVEGVAMTEMVSLTDHVFTVPAATYDASEYDEALFS